MTAAIVVVAVVGETTAAVPAAAVEITVAVRTMVEVTVAVLMETTTTVFLMMETAAQLGTVTTVVEEEEEEVESFMGKRSHTKLIGIRRKINVLFCKQLALVSSRANSHCYEDVIIIITVLNSHHPPHMQFPSYI